jgi:CRISPR-associated endonuclease Csn1
VSQPYILGIDLGSSSIGWALVGLHKNSEPETLLHTGVRIFDPGVAGTEMDILQGKDESKAVERRQARLQRRMLRRRAGRQRDLFELLQSHSLLPPYDHTFTRAKPHITNAQKSAARHQILEQLDRELFAKWKPQMAASPLRPAAPDHVLPYFLRATALSERLPLFELGRVLYHLGQRRGFKSNRRETTKTKEQEEEKSKVYAGISEISQGMQETGAPTLGSFFSAQDPLQRRIRSRWTARSMFESEFEAVWQAQSIHHPTILTTELKKQIHHLLFFQRPIAAQKHLVGECELEPGRKRAPMACLEAQRFRLLQKVNDLRVRFADFTERKLTAEERTKLIVELEHTGGLSFADMRKLLGLPKRGAWFNLEKGGEKRMPGNRTASKMVEAFGDHWNQLSPESRNQIVEEWRTSETEDWLVRRGMTRWGLDEIHARKWAEGNPEDGYARLSKKALQKLLSMMEDGFPFKEAEKEIYGTRFSGGTVHDLLPPVRNALPSLRNPAVERALTELRKLVNAIVREYGKPYEIHVELARDLKRSRDDRKEMWKLNRERQGRREKLAQDIEKKTGLKKPTRADIEKAMLWEECGGICPYTGKSIKFADLFGDHPQFDVEHILPFGRCPDNSFGNKTLCYADENRNVKRRRTPWEAYGANTKRWEEILERVKRWKNPAKLRRFEAKTEEAISEFSSRQLNDTRYASKLAAEYLGALYGGRDVPNGEGTNRRVIYASPGGLTADLRRNWGLEEILREPDPAANEARLPKARGDHRHHAVDAIVIALSTPAALKALSDAAERNAKRGRTSFKGAETPWKDFVPSIRPHIENLIVSHRPEHKLSGQLHDQTLYGTPYEENGKTFVHVRKPVDALSKNEIEDIVDPVVRKAVEKRLKELGGDLKKLQSAGVDPPFLKTKKGETIPIRRVRIRKTMTPVPIGNDSRLRFVAPNNNHHMEIIAEHDEREREISWNGVPISLLDAMNRKRGGQPLIQRDHGNDHRFKFSLMGGDTIEVQEDGKSQIYVVRSVWSNGQFTLVRVNDARKLNDMKTAKQIWFPNAETLRKHDARKVVVDILGKVHPAND